MKDPRFIFSTVLVFALAAFGFTEWQKVGGLEREIAQLKAAAAAQAESALADAAKLRRQIEDRTAAITQMEEQRKAVASQDARAVETVDEAGKPTPVTPDFGAMMKKMFTDPESKKAMRGMQMMGVRMMYSDLAKELGIKPDQATQVMEILGDRQMALTTKGMKMFGGKDGVAVKANEVGKEMETAKEDYDAQLESILGKDGMAKLGDYEKSVGDRMQMQQYKQAFAANGLPLDDNESQGLLSIMKEERAKQPASPLDPGAKDIGAAMQAIQSEETFKNLMKEREVVDQRVLSRARNVLTPDKMVQFEGIQKQAADLQKMQIEMARPFLSPKK